MALPINLKPASWLSNIQQFDRIEPKERQK